MRAPVAQWIEHRSSKGEPDNPSDRVRDRPGNAPYYHSRDRSYQVTAGIACGSVTGSAKMERADPVSIAMLRQ